MNINKSKRERIFTTSDPTVIIRRLVGLKDIRVLAYTRDGACQWLEIEQAPHVEYCASCGSRARVKDRPRVIYVDLPVYGRAMRLVWRKHRWYCPNMACARRSWLGQDKRIASSRMKLTTRAAKWATRQVGSGRTVRDVARELDCDWHTVNNAVTYYGSALLHADTKRVRRTRAIGLDETSFVRLDLQRMQYATTVCDVQHRQIIDILPTRDYQHVARYLHEQPADYKQHIQYATLDMSATYHAVFNTIVPHATQIVDHFHVIQLANRTLDRVRRRVQVETQGHRGRKTDPLYRIRRTLVTAEERLARDTSQRLNNMLALGDPQGEVAFTHRIKERLRETYQQDNYQQASRMLNDLIDTAGRASSPPEVQQLARTLNRWKPQILAYQHTKLSNGPTESINNLIKHIKHIGYGFTNFTNYRTRILLYAGNPNWRLLNTIFP